MTAATPLRSTAPTAPPHIDEHTDTTAARLLSLLEAADDLSSWSDDLAIVGRSWPDSYHLHPSRANVLRTLPIPPAATVLEIGARSGALTRFLGEQASIVDAVESDASLAAVAVARCAELEHVEVRVGTIDSVPVEAAYDVVIALETAQEIAEGSTTLEQFVGRCRSLLRPGGLLVVGADNSESVRATVGGGPPAPAGRIATSTAADLEAAAATAGLASTMLSAFPDHLHTQLLYSYERLNDLRPAFLVDLPKFSLPASAPSHVPDPILQGAWEESVAAGTAVRGASSLVMIAGEITPQLEDAAAFWSTGRAAAQSACNRVRAEEGRPVVVRTRAFPDAPSSDDPLRLRPHVEPVAEGTSMIHAIMQAPDLSRAADLLRQWADMVEKAGADGTDVPWDLIPRNVMVRPDGSVTAIDQEWELAGSDAETVLSRGYFWSAHELSVSPHPPGWLPTLSVGQTATFLRHLSGLPPAPSWLADFIVTEASQSAGAAPASRRHGRFMQVINNEGALMALSQSSRGQTAPVSEADVEGAESLDTMRDVLTSMFEENEALRQRISKLELEQRHLALVHRDHVVGLVAESERVRDALTRKQGESRRHKERIVKLQAQAAAMKSSMTWRIGHIIVRPFAVLGRMIRR